ncbi:MAG TPA: Hsp20/alpha crystallin family protein [Polaromonas sp.]|nr:Hsp20/alpha crystallin family protein [Polaromonas sp.]
MNQSNPMSQVSQPSQTGQPNEYGSYGGTPDDAFSQGGEVSSTEQRGQQPRTEPVTTILPPVDIFEDEAGFTLIADLPGVSKDQLVVRVTGDSLVIEGTATAPVTADMELLYGEVQNPQYRRSFTLSRELDPGKIEAKLSNGVLRLRIPKAEEAKPRRINVNVV